MDVPLALNYIGIRQGLKRYKRKSSTFSHTADVADFLRFIPVLFSYKMLKNVIAGYFVFFNFIKL